MSELFEKSMETLELPKVLELLAACAATDEGRERALSLRPMTDLEEIQREMLLSTAEELVSVWEELSSTWEEVLAGVLLSWEAEEPLASPQPARTVNSRARLSRSAAPRRKRLVCFMCVTSFLKRLDLRDGARLPQPWRKLWKKRAGKQSRG